MRHDILPSLDLTIANLEALLSRQQADCDGSATLPCSVGDYVEALPRGLARLQALRRARRVLRRLPLLQRPDACRGEAARYAKGGASWCAVPGTDQRGSLRREGFAAAAADLDAIVTRVAQRNARHQAAA